MSKSGIANNSSLSEMLETLTSLGGISAMESDISAQLKGFLDPLCDLVEIDKFGNITGYIKANDKDAKTLMLEAHYDRIGLMVSEICDDGYIKFTNIGGVDERILPSSEVCVLSDEKIYGLIFAIEKDEKKNPTIEQLRIDTGMAYDELTQKVKVGDMILVMSKYTKLLGEQYSSGAMDNRAGVACILEALRNINREKLRYNLVVLFSVQEELGLHGAYTGAYSVKSDAAVVIDVTHGKTPDSKNETGVFDLGCGAVICRGPNFNYKYAKELIETAKKENIPYSIEVASGPSGTSAWALQISGGGIPSMLVSIPLKYMHTNVETLDLEDINAIIRLLTITAEGGVDID